MSAQVLPKCVPRGADRPKRLMSFKILQLGLFPGFFRKPIVHSLSETLVTMRFSVTRLTMAFEGVLSPSDQVRGGPLRPGR